MKKNKLKKKRIYKKSEKSFCKFAFLYNNNNPNNFLINLEKFLQILITNKNNKNKIKIYILILSLI